jgi:acyl-coenzyme A synthetase/AMP-(fatty) acid ligase
VLADSPLWVATFLALTRVGAVVAIASPATMRSALEDAVARARPALVCTDDDEFLPEAHRLDTAALGHMAASEIPDPGPAPSRATDPCYLLLTSGSTGPSKWAIHRHGDIPACIATYGRHVLRLRPQDVTWSVAALPTSYGLGNALYFPLGAGASSWITGEFPTPAEAARACEAGATALFGVPTFWARLARHAAAGRVDATSFRDVRLAVSAGEPLPGAVWRAVRDALGLELVDGLGSSEATNLYLSNRSGDARPNTVGRVVPGFDLRVEDDLGRPAAIGDAGELLVRGASVMAGYLDAPDATAAAVRDGWLRTGDLVVRERDASYRFVGRVGERFKSGGFWVDPARVEAILLEHPAVDEVGVAGVPDADGVLRVVALVAPLDGTDPDTLRGKLEQLAADELAPHEMPRHYVFTDMLPTAASGKVRRSELRGLMESLTGGAAL